MTNMPCWASVSPNFLKTLILLLNPGMHPSKPVLKTSKNGSRHLHVFTAYTYILVSLDNNLLKQSLSLEKEETEVQ